MARGRRGRELSYYSWRKEAKMSAARERLATQAWISPGAPGKRRPRSRFLRYLTIFVLVVAAATGIAALVLRWPGIAKFYREPARQSAVLPLLLAGEEHSAYTIS